MRINSSNNFPNLEVNNSTQTTNTTNNANNTNNIENISAPQIKTDSKDGRAAMRSAEMGINARVVASELQKNTGTPLSDITKDLSKYLRSNRQTDLDSLAKPEDQKKTVSEIFGNDAFQQDFSGNSKNAAKSKAAAAKGASTSGAKGATESQASAGVGGDAPMSLGALLAMVGSIMVKAIEKTMKKLEEAAKQLDAAVASGGGGNSGASGATGADNPANPADIGNANEPGNTSGTDTTGVNTPNADGSSLDPILEKLSTILGSMKELAKELSTAIKQFDMSNPTGAGNNQATNPDLTNILNKMQKLQAAAVELGTNGPKVVQDMVAKISDQAKGLDNIASKQTAPQTDNVANTADGAKSPTSATSTTGTASAANANVPAQAPQGGGGGGGTAALNQKIQELTFNLQQLQQSLNRVNETVTNLSRSQSDAQKSTVQNLSV